MLTLDEYNWKTAEISINKPWQRFKLNTLLCKELIMLRLNRKNERDIYCTFSNYARVLYSK